jgi:uncharacterized protein YcfJ
MAPPTATEAPPQQEAQQGGLVRGAAGGAAVGAIIDGGDGAAKGAAAGAVLGGMRRNSQKRGEQQKQENWEQEQAQQYTAKRNSCNRAYAACLEGRGYVEGSASRVDHIEEVEDRLVLQGAEDGRDDAKDGTGWTISIEKKTGRMVGTAAASQAAIVIFGACTEV